MTKKDFENRGIRRDCTNVSFSKVILHVFLRLVFYHQNKPYHHLVANPKKKEKNEKETKFG